MQNVKLSMEALWVNWADLIVDWFMNFFADPEYYWVEETYPGQIKRSVIVKNSLIKRVQKTNLHFLKSLILCLINSLKDFPLQECQKYIRKSWKHMIFQLKLSHQYITNCLYLMQT